jgi:plasmid stabilization system protein ParE
MYTVILHPLSKQDYEEAYDWYETKQAGLGERFLIAVRKKIDSIALQPDAFGSKQVTDFREAKVAAFPYLIVYSVDYRKKEIYILSIHHTKKHPEKKFRKP